jgi:AcrR family transcriptional regulator
MSARGRERRRVGRRTAPARRHPRPGRPRDPEVDAAILAAAERVLRERGFQGMSMEAVAAEAGVGKAAIYRRYAGKTDLAAATLAGVRGVDETPDSGDPRADLVEHLRSFRRAVDAAGMSLVGTLLVEQERTPELLQDFRERAIRPNRGRAHAILERARERGELRAGADLELALDMLAGALFARHLTGAAFPRDWEKRAVDAVWRSIAR